VTTGEKVTPDRPEVLDLSISGMTCAGCAVKVERALNGLPGVDASVNAMTDSARVSFEPLTSTQDEILEAVKSVGYGAAIAGAHHSQSNGGEQHDHASHGMASGDGLGPRLAVSACLTVPLLAIGMIPALQFNGWAWVSLVLATPVALWGAWPFHRVAFLSLRHRSVGMDALVSLGVLAAWGWSLGALIFGGAGESSMTMGFDLTLDRSAAGSDVYFEVAAAVTTLVLLGRVLESRAKSRAGAAVEALLDLVPPAATVVDADGSERSVPAAELLVGDRFVVKPGERIATDGEVEAGSSSVDRSILTGESLPEEVGPGNMVAGATVNVGGRLIVRATEVGENTELSRIAAIVRDAQARKAPVQKIVDQVSAIFVPSVIALAVVTFIGWLLVGASAAGALTAAVAVLVVACPCALGLATPAALLVASGRGAQLGILVRGPEALEASRNVDVVVLDKTGTLTTGQLEVAELFVAEGNDRSEVLAIAGSVAAASSHPAARSLAAEATAPTEAMVLEDLLEQGGLGVAATVNGTRVTVGRPEHLVAEGLGFNALGAAVDSQRELGRAVVAAGWDGEVRLVAGMSDSLREGAVQAVEAIKSLGARPVLLTGDSRAAAEVVAAQLGISEVRAEVLPGGKSSAVSEIQATGKRVAMAGDGINDTPALVAADLGIAVGGGADAAVEAADLALLRPDPRLIADSILLSRKALSTIRWNLAWAFGYNVAALPLAVAGLLQPIIASAAMAFSSLFVIGNALRLRRFKGITPAIGAVGASPARDRQRDPRS